MVEHATVNRRVEGSSPSSGAIFSYSIGSQLFETSTSGRCFAVPNLVHALPD